MSDNDCNKMIRGGQALNEAEHLDLIANVQIGGGLVKQEQARPLGERARQHGSLEFAAADFRHSALRELSQARLLDRPVHPPLVLCRFEESATEMRVTALTHKFTDLERKQQRRILARHSHPKCSGSRRELMKILSIQLDLSQKRFSVPAGNFEQR